MYLNSCRYKIVKPRIRISWSSSGRARLLLLLLFLCGMQSMAQTGAMRTMKYSSGSVYDIHFWQHSLRSQLYRLLQLEDLMTGRQNINFNAKLIRTENKGDYELKEVEINSTATRRIRVIVTNPTKERGPFPGVIVIHGHGGTQEIVYEMKSPYRAYARELARRNYVTIAPFVSQHTVYENDRLLMGERLFDCIRSVDYLETMANVDKTRIGCTGLSLGGEMTMWLAAMDTRIKASVVSGFLTKMGQLEQDHCLCWKFPGLRELVDFSDIYGLIAPRPLLFQIGRKEPDSQFPLTLAREAFIEVQKVYNDIGVPENVMLVPHEEGHVVEIPVLVNFIAKYLAGSEMAY